MIRTSPALLNFPLWDSTIASDVIASCTPFVASDVIASTLPQQPELSAQPDQLPQQPELSVQPGQPEDTMTSATAPVATNVTHVVLILHFDKSAALHSIEKITNHGAKEWLTAQTKELATSRVAFKKVVIETKRTWKLLFEEVPQHALSEKIIPALASLVGSSGTVHELAQEEAEALFQTDEAHKNRMRSRADGVADTPRMQNFIEYAGAFHGSGGKAKKRRRMADKMVACVERAQRVQSAGLKELKPANSESDDDDNVTGVVVASVGTMGSSS